MGDPWYWAAKALAAGHLLLATFMVSGWLVIVIGGPLGLRFVRNFWFRAVHLGGFAVIAGFAAAGKLCPLTTLEYSLLARSGRDAGEPEPLVARVVEAALYPDVAPGLLLALTLLLGATTVLAWWIVPPERRGRRFGSGRAAG